jgi:hypothetical protein
MRHLHLGGGCPRQRGLWHLAASRVLRSTRSFGALSRPRLDGGESDGGADRHAQRDRRGDCHDQEIRAVSERSSWSYGPDARRDQAPGMPGSFQQASRSAAIGGRCQLVQVHEPSGNDGPLTIHRVLPYIPAAQHFQPRCSMNVPASPFSCCLVQFACLNRFDFEF